MRNAGLVIFFLLIGFVLSISTARYLSERLESSVVQPQGLLNAPGHSQSEADQEINPAESFAVLEPENNLALSEGTFAPAGPVTPAQDVSAAADDIPRSIFGEISRIVIPSLKLDAEVVFSPFDEFTWDVSTLGQRIAWLGDREGESLKNIILAGHVTLRDGSNGPFLYLFTMQPDETILIYTPEQVFTFKVREQFVVYPDDFTVTEDTPRPQLTLITCHTWDQATLTYLRRQVVLADLENVELRPSSALSEMRISSDQ